MATDELLRELNDDIQRERWAALWRRYGRQATTGVVLLVAGVVAVVAWQNYLRGQHEGATAQLLNGIALLERGDAAGAADVFHAVRESQRGTLAALAGLQEARARSVQKKPADAVAALKSVWALNGTPHEVRDMAALRLGILALNGGIPAADARPALEEIAGAGRPYAAQALEILGLLAASPEEKKQSAARIDAVLKNTAQELPPALRHRLEALAGGQE